MASAYEIATELLNVFGRNVVSGQGPMTYGYYAKAIGREPAQYGIAVGKAMHAIGALCVLKQVPVAPLYWVRFENGGYRGVFEKDPLERQYVIQSNDIETMFVVARNYCYSTSDFDGIEAALKKSLESESGGVSNWSPHKLWGAMFLNCPKDSTITFYERAMNRYRAQLVELKTARVPRK